jgi:hypothetical protein
MEKTDGEGGIANEGMLSLYCIEPLLARTGLTRGKPGL